MKNYYSRDYLALSMSSLLTEEQLVQFFLESYSHLHARYYDENGYITEELNKKLEGFVLGARVFGEWSLEKADDFTESVKSRVRELSATSKN